MWGAWGGEDVGKARVAIILLSFCNILKVKKGNIFSQGIVFIQLKSQGENNIKIQ